MTLIKALEILKYKGITKLVGMHGKTDINEYIENTVRCHEESVKYASEGIKCHQYELDHEDDHFMIEVDGHYIIATHYGNIDMPTYSDYDSEDKMNATFEEWQIMKQANEIADKKVASGSDMPHAAWVLIAIYELRKAREAASAAFEREYGCASS